MSTDELIAVMVPRRHLAKVYGFIATLDGEDQEEQPSNGRDSAVDTDEWTPSRIRRAVRESPPAMRDILMHMAKHAEKWLSTADLARAIENDPQADWKTVAGTLGAFGRRLGSRYAIQSSLFEQRHDHEIRGQVYRMPADIARQVLQALADKH